MSSCTSGLTLHTFGESGAPEPEFADKIMHGMLETDDGFALMAADSPPGMPYEGICVDRFGIGWMVNSAQPQA